ncbi:hypothetical protein ACWEFJ_39045 [Actinosynnema sp. NPDC004786]
MVGPNGSSKSTLFRADKLVDILVDRDEVDELRARADDHNAHAAYRLADLLVDRSDLDQSRARAYAGDSAAEAGSPTS